MPRSHKRLPLVCEHLELQFLGKGEESAKANGGEDKLQIDTVHATGSPTASASCALALPICAARSSTSRTSSWP